MIQGLGRLAVGVLLVSACTSTLDPVEATVREEIEFESLSFPGQLWEPFMPPASEGTTVTVTGTLTLPPTDEPVPAVVITHGCGGVGNGERAWARDLERAGYASFLVRSFEGRGVQRICRGEETVNIAGMLVDVYRAQQVLAEHPYVDGGRIAVLGLSFGGRTALWSALERFQERYDGGPFAAHVAFYPSTCYIELEDEAATRSGPIRILHGTADDWTPIGQCRDYIGRLQEAGVDAAILEYPDALHGFDDVTLPPRAGVPALSPADCRFAEQDGSIVDTDTGDIATVDAPCVRSGVTIGFSRQAREQAAEDLLELLDEALRR